MSFLLLLLPFWHAYLENYKVYYTYQTTDLPGIFHFWFGAAYELRLASYGLEIASKDASRASSANFGTSDTYAGRGTFSQTALGLLETNCK